MWICFTCSTERVSYGFLFKMVSTQSPLQALGVCNGNFETPCIWNQFAKTHTDLLLVYSLVKEVDMCNTIKKKLLNITVLENLNNT